jgi:hypothetical protein
MQGGQLLLWRTLKSGFVVTHSTIAAIVTYAQRRLWSYTLPPPFAGGETIKINDIDPDHISQALLVENVRSVNHRNRQSEPISTYQHVPTTAAVVSTGKTRTLTAMDILRLCHCVEYQSCKHPEWDTSWARGFLQRVADAAIHHLPGYDDAPSGLCA